VHTDETWESRKAKQVINSNVKVISFVRQCVSGNKITTVPLSSFFSSYTTPSELQWRPDLFQDRSLGSSDRVLSTWCAEVVEFVYFFARRAWTIGCQIKTKKIATLHSRRALDNPRYIFQEANFRSDNNSKIGNSDKVVI